jgi:hypothetical protein
MGTVLEMKASLSTALIALVALSACGNETDSSAANQVVRAVAATSLAKVKGGGAGEPQMTRARLAEVVTPVMLVTVENSGQEAMIAEVQTNRGVSTWSTVNDITISLRDGVIVATRGFGADLMAADVSPVSKGVGGGPAHRRTHTVLNGEDQAIRTEFTCRFRNGGTKTIEVVEIFYQTTQIVESCVAGRLSFENQYWLDIGQKMRRSRQWISSDAGYIIVSDVRP